MGLFVDTDIQTSTDLLGKSVSDLQSDINITDTAITGTLKYVTDYTGFSGDVSEQSGNYLALHIDTNEPVDSITVELVNGASGHPVTLDSDRLIIIRITNKATQKVRVVVNKDGIQQVKEYSLAGLTLLDS